VLLLSIDQELQKVIIEIIPVVRNQNILQKQKEYELDKKYPITKNHRISLI
jgi:hypothetical protein